MTLRRFICALLIPIFGLYLLTALPLFAQAPIPGGTNENPSTGNAPTVPPSGDKPSGDDSGRSPRPPGPAPTVPEGKKGCEDDKDPDAANPKGGPPKAPGSVDLTFSLEACPLEYSVAVGGMRLYFEKAEENMGDPVYLEYNSVAGARVIEQITTGLPAGVVRRYMIAQVSGKPLAFDLLTGNPVMKPSGSGASSDARAELRTESAITTNPALATRLRQYRSAGGYMEFALPAGNILKWSGPTGRSLDFPVDPAEGTAAMGLEVLRAGGKIRQIKSPAGMLDVTVDLDGRGYQVVTYLPSEIGAKTGGFYTLAQNAKPTKSVHIVHPAGTLKLVATYTDHSPEGSQDRVRTLTYTYNDTFDGGHEWDMMTEADGLTMKSTRHVVPDHDLPGMRRVVREVTDGAGKLLTRMEVVQQFETAWNGWTDVQEIETPAGDVALRTVRSYRYGKTPGQNDFRKLNWQMTETGLVYEFKYDAEGRMIERRSPWLDGAGGLFMIEKYSYVPFGPGEVVLPGDGRPRTTTVEVGTADGGNNPVISKSFFAAYNDAANGNRHTVINEDAATPGSAYGDAGNRRRKQVFYASSATADSGRLMEVTDENGLRMQYTYAARAGGGLIETMTGPIDASGASKAGVSRRVRREKDGFDRILLTREAFFDGTAYVDFHEDQNNYSPQGQLISVVRTDLKSNRQRLIFSYVWRGDQMVSMTAEDGSTRQTNTDGFGRMVSTTNAAIPAATSPLSGETYPARPAITRTTVGSMIADLDRADWGDHTVTTAAGSLSLQETAKVDARGRVYERTDADGYTDKTSHLRNGLETIVTRPDGSTVITKLYPDGRMKERTGTGIVPEFYSYVANPGGGVTTTVRQLRPDGPRYQSTTIDVLGRTVQIVVPGHGGVVSTTNSYVGGSSRLAKVVSSASQVPVRFYEYDSFATLIRQGETVRPGAAGLVVSSSNDRIQDGEMTMINDATGLWQVRKQFTYPNEGAMAATRYLLNETRSKIAGFLGNDIQQVYVVDALGNWQQQVTEVRVGDRVRIERGTSNAFTGESVSVYHASLLVEQRRPSDTASTRMTYDALGRLTSTKQPRHTNANAIVRAAGGNRVLSQTDANGAVTNFSYFPQGVVGAGQVAVVTLADNTVRRCAYDIRGNKTFEWGSATAPTAYGFDVYNQLTTLSTYRTNVTGDSAAWPTTTGAADVTTWVREEATGLLTQKQHADGLGPVYEYDLVGRMTRQTSARGLVTDYTYTAWGQPDVSNHQDTTPDVDTDYDRIGRKSRESNGTATSDFQYSPTTQLPTLETISYDLDRNGTPELIRQLERSHDNLRRATGFTLKAGTVLENQVVYGYDDFSRPTSVERPGIAPIPFSYTYVPNSSLLAAVTGPVHEVVNTWEPNRDVLDVKQSKVDETVISRFDYTVNGVGQRTACNQTGSAFASSRSSIWGYDGYGQLTSANSSVNSQDRSYQYDAIGNRKKFAESLTLPLVDNYSTNTLNQYSAIVSAQATTLNPAYDQDGNATAYPLSAAASANSTLVWDAENRLISSTVNGTTTTYQYDAVGRRIAKTIGANTQIYLYDGWNVIAEYSKSGAGAAILQKTYVWGLDLSGASQGAGGAGGLLAVISGSSVSYPTYDGNGNVSEYLNISGTVVAHFEYDPFGNAVVNTDATNQYTYRFSTKPFDVETGLYYYGYRYYDPLTGRWLNRDPIGEGGGINLYGMIGNDGINAVDVLGLESFEFAGETYSTTGVYLEGAKEAFKAMGKFAFYELPRDVVMIGVDTVVGIGEAAYTSVESTGQFLGGEVTYFQHMTLDEYSNTWEERYDRTLDAIYRIEEKLLDAGWRAEQIAAIKKSIYDTLSDPDCLEKLLRKGAAEALFAAATMGLSELRFAKAIPKIAPGPSWCFPEGTLVLMADGSTKAIDEIEAGDVVLADYVDDDKPASAREVLFRFDTKTKRLVSIGFGSKESPSEFESTGSHPIWVVEKGWVAAENIEIGDVLVGVDDGRYPVLFVTQRETLCATYNLDVEGIDSFFIVVNGNPILVHNQDLIGPYGPMPTAPGMQKHHVIQDAWVRENYGANYKADSMRNKATAIRLQQDPIHNSISNAQGAYRRERVAGGQGKYTTSIQEEFQNSAKWMREAGVDEAARRKALKKAYKYFDSIGAFCP